MTTDRFAGLHPVAAARARQILARVERARAEFPLTDDERALVARRREQRARPLEPGERPLRVQAWVVTFRSPAGREFRRLVQLRRGLGEGLETVVEWAWQERRLRGKPCDGWRLVDMVLVGHARYEGGSIFATVEGRALLNSLAELADRRS